MSRCVNCGAELSLSVRYCPDCGTQAVEESPADHLVGKTLSHKYRLISLLGEGSMGRVYLAEHVGLRKQVALKVLHPDLQVNEEFLRRFQLEGIAAGRFSHPNAIQIYDFDKADGLFYLAMEYVEGRSLRDVLRDAGRLPIRTAVHIVRQVLSALAQAHRQGIIHRDLKPDNIMVMDEPAPLPSIKVLDFGISKLIEPTGDLLKTQTGRIVGTPMYMSPEQCTGEPLDHRSDLYGVGLILFELVTGRPPFRGDSVTEILLKHAGEEAPRASAVSEDLDLPRDLEAIIHRALAKDRNQRFDAAEQMIEALDRIAYDKLASSRLPRLPLELLKRVRKNGVAALFVAVVAMAAFWAYDTLLTGSSSPRRVTEKPSARHTEEEQRYVSYLQEAYRLLRNQRTVDALRSVEDALRLQCRDSEAFLVRGKVHRERGELQEAAADFDQALKLDPKYADAVCGLGWVRLDRGELEQARGRFTEAERLGASPEALIGLGAVATREGHLPEAIDRLAQAVQIEPSSVLACCLLGQAELEAGDLEGALAAFSRAKRSDSMAWQAAAGLARVHERLGRPDEAETQYRTVLEINPGNVEASEFLAVRAIEKENYKEAERLLNEVLQREPEAARSQILLGLACEADGRVAEAITLLRAGLGNGARDAEAATLLGILLQSTGELEAAIEQYWAAIDIDPTLATPYGNMGLALVALERYEEAKNMFLAALDRDSENAFAHLSLGILYMEHLGDEAKAAEHLQRYRDLGGKDPRVNDWLTMLSG
ncbi:MAG: tetratricopeptide repeat protein [Planctomycetota bacterium]